MAIGSLLIPSSPPLGGVRAGSSTLGALGSVLGEGAAPPPVDATGIANSRWASWAAICAISCAGVEYSKNAAGSICRPCRSRSSDARLITRIESKPTKESLYDADGEHELLIRPTDLEPGVYRVVCRVKDTTELRGERYPWVLKDALGLLESERVWWIEIPPR